MLGVPGTAEETGGVLELAEPVEYVAAAGRRRVAPVDAKAVDRDGAEPNTEGPDPAVMREPGQLADELSQDVLDHVVDVGRLPDIGADPGTDKGRVQIDQLPP